MRGWLALTLVSALLLAGCAEKATDSSSTSAATAATTTAPTTAPAANRTNHAPTGGVTASASGLNVTFALTGSDEDRDPLTWTLALGDGGSGNGTALPTNVTHAYAKAGVFNVTYTLSDGRNSTVYHAAANVSAAGVVFTPVDATKTWIASAAGGVEFAAGCRADGVDCAYFDLPTNAQGRAFTMDFSATVPAAVYFVDYYDSSGYVDTFIGGPGATSIADKVPDGAIQFRAYATGGADFSAHLLVP